MNCQKYRDTLMESAAGGWHGLSAELAVHLQSCEECRRTYEGERLLFSAIDDVLRAAANADVPPSLFPKVRTRIAEEGRPRPAWVPYLIAASMMVTSIIAVFAWRGHSLRPATESGRLDKIAANNPPPEERTGQDFAPAGPSLVSREGPLQRGRRTAAPVTGAKRNPAEVLVPPDERLAWQQFVSAVPERREMAVVLVKPARAPGEETLSVKLIEIARLEVPPLAEQSESNETDEGNAQQ